VWSGRKDDKEYEDGGGKMFQVCRERAQVQGVPIVDKEEE